MIDISVHQIGTEMKIIPSKLPPLSFSKELINVFETVNRIEAITNIPSILTSNKPELFIS